MMEVEKDEEKEIDPLVTESKVTKALKQMVKEWSTLRVMLQTRKPRISTAIVFWIAYSNQLVSQIMIRCWLLQKNIVGNMKMTLDDTSSYVILSILYSHF